jgi:hypothetical protein
VGFLLLGSRYVSKACIPSYFNFKLKLQVELDHKAFSAAISHWKTGLPRLANHLGASSSTGYRALIAWGISMPSISGILCCGSNELA